MLCKGFCKQESYRAHGVFWKFYKNTKRKFSKFNAGSKYLKMPSLPQKKNVFVLMGGFTSEFEISIKSGQVVCKFLDKDLYRVFPCIISQKGWYSHDKDGNEFPVNPVDFSFNQNGEKIHPDLIFNTVHGSPGEDGHIAALCSLQNIPQTSTHFYAAALSFNKRDCLSVLKAHGIPCAESIHCNQGNTPDFSEVKGKLGLPFFVKPNRSGSSYGVSKVEDESQYTHALTTAFKEDHQILMERAIDGVEVSVGAYSHKGRPVIFCPTEIVPENDFFDLSAKYEGKAQEITPARIPQEQTEMVKTLTAKIYRILEMNGVCRADFIIENNQAYFIELNSTPGLSEASLIPKQVAHSGLDLTEFFNRLIQETLIKHK